MGKMRHHDEHLADDLGDTDERFCIRCGGEMRRRRPPTGVYWIGCGPLDPDDGAELYICRRCIVDGWLGVLLGDLLHDESESSRKRIIQRTLDEADRVIEAQQARAELRATPEYPDYAIKPILNGKITDEDGEVVYDLEENDMAAVRCTAIVNGHEAAVLIPAPVEALDWPEGRFRREIAPAVETAFRRLVEDRGW